MKSKYTILLPFILLFSISSISFGQTYNEIITKAYSCAYVENDLNQAAQLFDKAFKTSKAKSSELYYAAEINLNIDSIEKFKLYFSQAVNSGYANYDYIKKINKFKTQFDSYKWDTLMSIVKTNHSKFEKEYVNLKNTLPGYYSIKKQILGKIDLRNDTLKVKHQGKRNTCSVFAATTLIEYLIWYKKNKYVDLSEAYNYWAAKTFTLTNDYLKEGYTSVDGLAGYLAIEAYKYGSMKEDSWKYEKKNWLKNKDKRCIKINDNYIKECFTGVPPENSEKYNLTAQPVYIDRKDIGQYILQEKKPVAMNIFWYFDAIEREIGDFRMPTEKDIRKGGHVILLVGYDSETKTFIFQNSWGTNWGNNGFGTIPEKYILEYYELAEVFPYGIDASIDEKIESIKGSLGVSAKLD